MSIKLITEPTVIVLAEMETDTYGLRYLAAWLKENRPECQVSDWSELTPDPGCGGNKELTEIAGRTCYMSFGAKAGRKSNREYMRNILPPPDSGRIPHASVLYHAKMTFFIAGISRRVSHELIRHYVGADRTEEGSPSQESTRYTHHPGHFVIHPRMLSAGGEWVEDFKDCMKQGYNMYLDYIEGEAEAYKEKNDGAEPKGIERKRIYEAAAGLLPMQAATSMVWTTNPIALAKLFKERCSEAADLEFQRLALRWRDICHDRWPNLFAETLHRGT